MKIATSKTVQMGICCPTAQLLRMKFYQGEYSKDSTDHTIFEGGKTNCNVATDKEKGQAVLFWNASRPGFGRHIDSSPLMRKTMQAADTAGVLNLNADPNT